MSTLNCKMCAAPLKYVEGKQIIECEFDKVSGVYEVIVSEYPDEAEV